MYRYTDEDRAVIAAALLEQFKEKASKGQVVDISEIKACYEKAVGHTIGSAQTSPVLYREAGETVEITECGHYQV